jgi:hypothetical protein
MTDEEDTEAKVYVTSSRAGTALLVHVYCSGLFDRWVSYDLGMISIKSGKSVKECLDDLKYKTSWKEHIHQADENNKRWDWLWQGRKVQGE